MDRRIVLAKLESLRRCVRRVESRRPETVEALEANIDLQDILTLNVTRAVQVAVDVASRIAVDLDADVAARMRAAVGFRNVAVHAYQEIDWAVVFAVSHDRLGDFRAFARAVVEHLDSSAR